MFGRLPGTAVATAALAAITGPFRWLLGEESPQVDPAPGSVESSSARIDGFERNWITYRPASAQPDAPILIVLHGTGGNGADLRRNLGYRFDHLAAMHGFVVVYPDGWEGNWNEARRGGKFPAKSAGVDDTAFIRTLVAQTAGDVPPSAVWLSGHSSGGQMALRASLEASSLIDAFAASAAGVPTSDNWQPGVRDDRARPVDALFIAGDRDPVNPINGGRVGLFGFLGNRGTVLSAWDGAQWFRQRNSPLAPDHDTVALRIVQGNGHHFVVPGRRGPRLLGPTAEGVDLAEEVVAFLTRPRT